MIDYELKAWVLSEHTDLLRVQRHVSRVRYLSEYFPEKVSQEEIETADAVFYFFEADPGCPDDARKLWQECRKINRATTERSFRLKAKIGGLLESGTCYFLTLTFSDDTLSETSRQTRRKYVTLFLKSISEKYVANIDFGEQNGREHYHAVVLADKVSLSDWEQYGFGNAKKVRKKTDNVALGKYIGKLTNHAIKATTKGNRAIYSRNTPSSPQWVDLIEWEPVADEDMPF